MKEYLRILNNVLTHGVAKQPTRFDSNGVAIPVENGTIGTFCEVFRHNMADGFPLLTSRQMPWRSIRVELEGFIKGITSKSWFQERKCKFWSEWCNPEALPKDMPWPCNEMGGPPSPHESKEKIDRELKKYYQLKTDDLGPIYGYQWRNFGQQYGKVTSEDYIEGGCDCLGDYQQIYKNVNGIGYFGDEEGYDQLKYIVDTLKTNPYDRRMVCSAWNPNQLHLSALPACHCMFGVVVYGNKLNLWWVQRSNDFYLGNPSNIASYGLLLLLLAKESGLEPGTLHGTFSDCHLYLNQIDAARELLTRPTFPLPKVSIPDDWGGIWEWDYTKVVTENYQCGEKLSMGVTV